MKTDIRKIPAGRDACRYFASELPTAELSHPRAAVDVQRRAGDKSLPLACQENHGPRDVVRSAGTPQGNTSDRCLSTFRRSVRRVKTRAEDQPWRHGVHPNSLRPKLR